MRLYLFVFLLSLVAPEAFSQKKKSGQDISNAHHYRNTVSVRNFDGTRSNIRRNGGFTTLINPDGTQSTIEYLGNFSNLVAADGTTSTVFHNRMTSTINIPDGTRVVINHRPASSFSSSEYGKHTILHTFAGVDERYNKTEVDILSHMNWLMQKKALADAANTVEEESLN